MTNYLGFVFDEVDFGFAGLGWRDRWQADLGRFFRFFNEHVDESFLFVRLGQGRDDRSGRSGWRWRLDEDDLVMFLRRGQRCERSGRSFLDRLWRWDVNVDVLLDQGRTTAPESGKSTAGTAATETAAPETRATAETAASARETAGSAAQETAAAAPAAVTETAAAGTRARAVRETTPETTATATSAVTAPETSAQAVCENTTATRGTVTAAWSTVRVAGFRTSHRHRGECHDLENGGKH